MKPLLRLARWLPAALLVSAPAAAGSPPPATAEDAAADSRDGRPTCGLGRDFHAGRRAELRRRLGRGLIVARGLPPARDWAEFRQDKTFWYLTGIESPDAALVMDAESGREVLFLPPHRRVIEVWEGEQWDAEDDWVPELSGIADVRPSDQLLAFLEEAAPQHERVWVSLHPHVALAGAADRARPYDRRVESDPLDGRPSREGALAARLREHLGLDVRDMAPQLVEMRRVKTPEEIDALRRAGRAGVLAMIEGMRSTRPGLGEWELDALMSYVHARAGADGPAYYAIVGSGPRSCVLHYNASARRMAAGEVLLVDFGCELDHYTTDITRTWPVAGAFDERQAELYDAVLAAQEAGIAAVRPGATLAQVAAACNEVFAERGLAGLVIHGPSHYIGLEVHDPGDPSAPLVPGVAFTVEPGLYDREAGVGVRIEDVVVVTESGCEVLTAGVPKARAVVEALVAEEGIVDWLERRDGER